MKSSAAMERRKTASAWPQRHGSGGNPISAMGAESSISPVGAPQPMNRSTMFGLTQQSRGDHRSCVANDHTSPLAAEALAQQIVGPVGDSLPRTRSDAEERRWPRTILHGAEAATDVGQRLRHLVFRQVLDQAQQLISLGTHAYESRGVRAARLLTPLAVARDGRGEGAGGT